jgi:hypothetical protein
MGIIQGIKERIKDFYYAGEGKWYGFFDKVDSKIPVYKVIDKIDSVIPSFALFLILIFILILVLGYSFLGTISTAGTATFEITNYDGQKFAGQNIIITLEDGKILEKTTNNNGIVSFENIENEILITLDINTSEVRYKETYVMTDDFYEFINLTRRVDLSPKTKTVILQNELRIRILEPVEVIFYCENTGVTPEPASTISQDGIVNITEPFNCGRLYLKPVSDNYESRPYQITTPQQLIQLKKYEPSKKQAIIKIRDNNKTITDTSFNVTLTGRNTYTGRTNSSSQAIIEVVPGIYNVSIADPSGNYGIATSLIEIVDKDGEITVNVSKTVKAIITITIRDESNNALIKGAKVALIKSAKELLSQETDETGKVLFFINDTGDYVVSAKKVGDVGEGYFAKMIDLENVSSDVSAEIKLEKVTIANAGKVSVRVIDQDDEPVDNARVILKYLKNDSIVELNSTKNYVLTDLNGESKLLAGKVEGEIVAYASKHPFFGTSNKGIVEIDKENEFEVRMEVGLTRVNINVTDKDGEPINAVAEIFNAQNNSLTGLINIESKTVVRDIKAGRKIHAVIQAEGYENYTTAPIDLWPDTPVNLSVSLKREITQPSIEHIGLYDESGRLAMGMTAGKKYYTKFLINSDDTYENVDLHFRIGDVTHLTNEYMEVERIEGEGITREMRGISYDPILGYEYDSKNFTVGNAKWITVSWDNFGKGTKEVKVYFRVKANTPPNRELQYFWRGTFDNLRRPESTKEQEFYSDVYFSKIYYQGSVEECETEFCISSEWLYSQEEELYINKPYEMKQVADYKYTFQLLNNSQFNYTAAQKPIYLYITVLGNNNNEKMLRFKNYKITDKLGEVVGGQGYIVDKIALNSFETQTAVDVELDLEGIKSGGEIIRIRLQSEGVEIFSEDITFNVLSNKPLTVTFDPTKIPSLLNTEIVAKVFDDKGESIEGADLKIYAKEPGYDEYDVDSTKTNRFGTGILNSGAFFPGTKLFVEIQKIGFARAIYQLTLTDIITSFNPETISIQMNTITERDVKEKVKITNQITHDLELFDIVLDSALEGLIKEEAFKSYFEQFRGEEIKGKETKEYELIRAQLSEDVTPQSLPDGHSVEGTLLIGFRPKGSSVLYDVKLPLIVNISSHAPMEAAACMRITNAKQSKVTQTGRVIFNFELTNACQANRKDIKLDNISASTTSAFGGQAEITLQSMTTAKSGRSALSGTDRQLVTDISQNEVFAGTVTYIPSQSETGGSVKLNVNIKGKYGQQEIATIPGNLDLTVDVINLRECIRITSDSSPVAFDASSILTIDASGCQGQSVDIQLCKDDARCAGGVEGGVTLSTKSFNLKGESKTVEVYSPSLPGTYGITVHARQDGTGSFTYIGEAVVGFKEEDTKRFKLNKTDFMLLGNDSRDSALLTNTLLIESVKVKANDCVWGKKSVKFDWPGALTGAMLGASIGSMVGGAFDRGGKEPKARDEITEKASAAEAGDAKTTDTRDVTVSQDNVGITYDYGVDGQDLVLGMEVDTINVGQMGSTPHQYNLGADNSINIGNNDYTVVGVSGIGTGSQGYNGTSIIVQDSTGNTFTVTPITQGDGLISQNFAPYTKPTYSSVDTLPSGSSITNVTQLGDGSFNTTYKTPTGQNVTFNTPSSNQPIAPQSNTMPQTETINGQTITTEFYNFGIIPDLLPGFENPLIKSIGQIFTSENQNKVERLSFASKTVEPITQVVRFASGGRGAGYGALIGAVAGALIMGFAGSIDCADTHNIVEFTDFVTFLQGDQIEIYNMNTKKNETKTIPSDGDAGALDITMGNTSGSISAEWDFRNADYSTEENVALTFKNNGMNEAQAKYGLLTIQAIEHIHGDYTHSNIDNEFDVVCRNSNFSNYWIGAKEDEGLCSGITKRTYSQQYHIRVTSGEPQDNAPYLRKSSSCYMGTLSGSTGRDAVPRIKLNWDWDFIEYDSCDYANPDYIYCDATQFGIALTKRLAILKDFLEQNPSLDCPPNRTIANIEDDLARYDTGISLVGEGFIGVSSIDVLVNHEEDFTTVNIHVDNKTGSALETNMTFSVKGEGEGMSETITETFPVGENIYNIEIDTPEWSGVYMATATFSGPKGNRRAITKAFLNVGENQDCWAKTSTEALAGLPSLYYYVSQADNINYTNDVQSETDLLNLIVFRAHLIKDNYSNSFFNDFKRYYTTTPLQYPTNRSQQKVLENFDNFKINKKYTNESEINAGLYYVWLNVGMGEDLQIFNEDTNTDMEAQLLLIKNPSTMFPLYNIPFNGAIGFDSGRENYGASFENEDEEIILNNTTLINARTFSSPIDNGYVKLTTKRNENIQSLTSGLSTKGQLMSISSNGSNAVLNFTPSYATPVMARNVGSLGTDELFAYQLEVQGIPQNTGGNMNYWTGAAFSYDFYGALAAETFYDTADYQLDDGTGITAPGVTYGFNWKDIVYDSSLYLKTIFYTPMNKSSLLKIDNGGSKLWTPNQGFGASAQLNGIFGMNYNDATAASSINTVQELLDLVEDGKVCITNDGSSMKFWWNPKVIATTPGSTGQSLEGSEASLIGN